LKVAEDALLTANRTAEAKQLEHQQSIDVISDTASREVQTFVNLKTRVKVLGDDKRKLQDQLSQTSKQLATAQNEKTLSQATIKQLIFACSGRPPHGDVVKRSRGTSYKVLYHGLTVNRRNWFRKAFHKQGLAGFVKYQEEIRIMTNPVCGGQEADTPIFRILRHLHREQSERRNRQIRQAM